MSNFDTRVSSAKAWATSHVVAAVVIGAVIGFAVHALLF